MQLTALPAKLDEVLHTSPHNQALYHQLEKAANPHQPAATLDVAVDAELCTCSLVVEDFAS